MRAVTLPDSRLEVRGMLVSLDILPFGVSCFLVIDSFVSFIRIMHSYFTFLLILFI